jgi:curved DNA-binding protein CbpA
MPRRPVEAKQETTGAQEKPTHYSLLGVREEASADELKKAFRQLALQQHPDKGGDDDKFHAIKQAHAILEDDKKRAEYDEELRKARDRASLVEGIPESKGDASKGDAAIREKTAPTPGSKSSMKKQAQCMGWKALGTGAQAMKAIKDDASDEAVAEALFQKYAALPKVQEKRAKWARSITGEMKTKLKNCAKAHEKKEMEKWQKWLNK